MYLLKNLFQIIFNEIKLRTAALSVLLKYIVTISTLFTSMLKSESKVESLHIL